MAHKPPDTKTQTLRAAGALHPHPERVLDEAFRRREFFDPRDLVQVKYEMVRRHQVDGRPVTEVVSVFGTSRQAFYIAQSAFDVAGVAGLLPRPRGPRRAHKCTDEILDFIEQWRAAPSRDSTESLAQALRRRFGVTLHPRSIDRALIRRKKKRLPADRRSL